MPVPHQLIAQDHSDRLKCTARQDRQKDECKCPSPAVWGKIWRVLQKGGQKWAALDVTLMQVHERGHWDTLTQGIDAGPCDTMKHWPCSPDLLPPEVGKGRVSQSHRHLRKMTNTSSKARQITKHTNTAVFGTHRRLHWAQLLKVLLKVFFPQFYLHNQISITHECFWRCSQNRQIFLHIYVAC